MRFTKSTVVVVIKFVVKYIVPIVCGYLEGDTHAISDAIVSLF